MIQGQKINRAPYEFPKKVFLWNTPLDSEQCYILRKSMESNFPKIKKWVYLNQLDINSDAQSGKTNTNPMIWKLIWSEKVTSTASFLGQAGASFQLAVNTLSRCSRNIPFQQNHPRCELPTKMGRDSPLHRPSLWVVLYYGRVSQSPNPG